MILEKDHVWGPGEAPRRLAPVCPPLGICTSHRICRSWAWWPSGSVALADTWLWSTPTSLFQQAQANHTALPSPPKGPVNLLPISKISLFYSPPHWFVGILHIFWLLSVIGVANTLSSPWLNVSWQDGSCHSFSPWVQRARYTATQILYEGTYCSDLKENGLSSPLEAFLPLSLCLLNDSSMFEPKERQAKPFQIKWAYSLMCPAILNVTPEAQVCPWLGFFSCLDPKV